MSEGGRIETEALTALDNYLVLSRQDRAAIYRKLSLSDRRQLDALLGNHISPESSGFEAREKKRRSIKPATDFESCSPWLSARIAVLLSEADNMMGRNTRSYLQGLMNSKNDNYA